MSNDKSPRSASGSGPNGSGGGAAATRAAGAGARTTAGSPPSKTSPGSKLEKLRLDVARDASVGPDTTIVHRKCNLHEVFFISNTVEFRLVFYQYVLLIQT